VPVVGQGTWQLALRGHGAEEAAAALHLGIDLGLVHIDTAEMYGDGRVEEFLGAHLAGRRAQVFIASKVLPQHASYRGTLAACDRSLRRLRIDCLDLYMLHWPGRHPIAETMAAMEALVDAGKVRHIGVSNFEVDALRAAQRVLTKHRLVANQVPYHLGDRGVENHLLPYCAREGITIVAYSPFGSGRLPSTATSGGRALARVAARRGCSPHQVALAYLIRDEHVVAIPKASTLEHVRANAAAADLRLLPSDVAEIDREFPRPPRGTPLGVI
jgi:diketogulonate reductase-like aldo/keto reductase